MKKFSEIWSLIKKKNTKSIYNRILYATLWGSIITFVIMSVVASFSALTLYGIIDDRGRTLSTRVGDYLKHTVSEESQRHLSETMVLKSLLVSRILRNCSLNVELIADKMREVLHNPYGHRPQNLPIANYEVVPNTTPYVFYEQDLLKRGLTPKLLEEISYASSIYDDLLLLKRAYYKSFFVASKKGYMIGMDMVKDGNIGSSLSYEPLKSSYTVKNYSWYKELEKEPKLTFTNPYVSAYDNYCISIVAPYYDGNGYAGVVGVDIDEGYIEAHIANSSDDETDFTFIMGENGEIIVSGIKEGVFANKDMMQDLRQSPEQSLSDVATKMVNKETGITTVKADGKTYYIAYGPIKYTDWSLGVIIDENEFAKSATTLEDYVINAVNNYNIELHKFFALMAVIASVIVIIALRLIIRENQRMAKGFAAPIQLLNDGAKEIAKGNLEKKLEVKTGDEIETLAENFNVMTQELSAYMKNLKQTTAANERIKTELAVATHIQSGMLPKVTDEFKNRKEFELAALMYPAKEVGGDFYDFYMLDPAHLVVTVADVSDKGVPAALFMVIAKTMLKENLLFSGSADKLEEVFEKTNNALEESNDAYMFVTVFTGVLDLESGKFAYLNAGHNPPIAHTKEGLAYLPKASSPIMGALRGIKYTAQTLELKPNDSLLLYTDGVTEARYGKTEMFGEERLLETAKAAGNNPKADIEHIYVQIKEYVKDTVQSDDITILEVIYRGKQSENGQ